MAESLFHWPCIGRRWAEPEAVNQPGWPRWWSREEQSFLCLACSTPPGSRPENESTVSQYNSAGMTKRIFMEEEGHLERTDKWVTEDFKHLFLSTGRMSGWDDVRHLLHTVPGHTLQHKLLVRSLKEVKIWFIWVQSCTYTLGGDKGCVLLPKKNPPSSLYSKKLI